MSCPCSPGNICTGRGTAVRTEHLGHSQRFPLPHAHPHRIFWSWTWPLWKEKEPAFQIQAANFIFNMIQYQNYQNAGTVARFRVTQYITCKSSLLNLKQLRSWTRPKQAKDEKWTVSKDHLMLLVLCFQSTWGCLSEDSAPHGFLSDARERRYISCSRTFMLNGQNAVATSLQQEQRRGAFLSSFLEFHSEEQSHSRSLKAYKK